MTPSNALIILDRDGVLNSMRIDPEHGTIDSPLHPDQVEVYPWVPEAIQILTQAGYGIAIATNQPSWAKGKTTQANLQAVHLKVLQIAQSLGGKILSSHICFHRNEDQCSCRKPTPGLLKEAFAQNPAFRPEFSWMVGDGVTDIEAGKALDLKTAFLGPRKCDACKIFQERGLEPLYFSNLLEFAEHFK